MRIAAVDDSAAERGWLLSALKEYAAMRGLELKTDAFAGGEELLGAFQPYVFSAVFLDIFMDGMTGVETDNGPQWDCIMDILENAICNETDPSAQQELKEFCSSNAFDTVCASSVRSPMEKLLNGKNIHFKEKKLLENIGFPCSVIPIPATYMTKDRGGNIHTVKFDFSETTCRFTWHEGNCMNTVECGMDGSYRYTKGFVCSRPYLFASAAAWEDNYTLKVVLRPMECLASRILIFRFENGKATMTPSMYPSSSIIVDNVAGTVRGMAKSESMKKLADKGLQKLQSVMEPVLKGTYD